MATIEVKCGQCGGSGRVHRVRRRLPDGSFDPMDMLWTNASEELCSKCGGSGKVTSDVTVTEGEKGSSSY
jgi:DnaJ-class molecular chaperone